MYNLRNRSFLRLTDFTPKDIRYFLDLARDLKRAKYAGIEQKKLLGKNVVLIFEKDSTRTRCSFEIAAYDQGANVTYIGSSGSQFGKKESVADTARVLGRMYDGIEFRGYRQQDVEDLAKYSNVPVWNGLTDEAHPTQILADFLTIEEHLGHLKGVKLAFLGDGRNNMANSLMEGSALMGLDFRVVAPDSLHTDAALVKKCQEIAKKTGAKITVTSNVEEGVKGVDAIYTDVWVSMGEPMEAWEQRVNALKPYQVNQAMFDKAAPHAIFLHCLPAFHDNKTTAGEEVAKRFGMTTGIEVTDDIFEGPRSVVFDEAENRLHTIKAIMVATLGE